MNEFVIRLYAVMQSSLLDLHKRSESERGATAVEYGLLIALIAGVIILAVTALGLKVQGAFNAVANAIP